MNKRISLEIPLIYALLLLGSWLMLLPLLWMVSASFKTLYEVMQVPPVWIPKKFILDNYRQVLLQFPMIRYLFNTLFVSVIVVLSVLLTSAMAGYALTKMRFRWAQAVLVLFLSSLMIPFQVRMIPLYKMTADLKLLDTFTGVVLPWLVDAFGIFLMRQFMLTVPDEYIDAARIDGASEWQIFWRIILPQVRVALASLAIFTFTHMWEEYLWPLLVATSDRTRTLPVGLQYFSEQYGTNIHYQMAAATLGVAPMLIAFLLLQRQFVRGVTLTGLR